MGDSTSRAEHSSPTRPPGSDTRPLADRNIHAHSSEGILIFDSNRVVRDTGPSVAHLLSLSAGSGRVGETLDHFIDSETSARLMTLVHASSPGAPASILRTCGPNPTLELTLLPGDELHTLLIRDTTDIQLLEDQNLQLQNRLASLSTR